MNREGLQAVLDPERRAVLDDDVLEDGENAPRLRPQRSQRQRAKQAAEHLAHELGEAGASEPVVERLVGRADPVLVVELSEQIGERLHLRSGQRRDDRQEQTVRRHDAQALALTGFASQIVHLVR